LAQPVKIKRKSHISHIPKLSDSNSVRPAENRNFTFVKGQLFVPLRVPPASFMFWRDIMRD
jgi:hypothetical protein